MAYHQQAKKENVHKAWTKVKPLEEERRNRKCLSCDTRLTLPIHLVSCEKIFFMSQPHLEYRKIQFYDG